MLPLPDLITYFTRKEKMFLLSLFEDVLLVAMSICGCVNRCNKESQMCCCPGSDSVSKYEEKAGWATLLRGQMNHRCVFVVSCSLSGAYILCSWIESLMLILSGGENCHIKPTSFTETAVSWNVFLLWSRFSHFDTNNQIQKTRNMVWKVLLSTLVTALRCARSKQL